MKINKISASAYKTWEKCEFAYFVNYILKLDGDPNWGALNGSVIHEVIEEYLKDKRKNWRKLLPQIYQKHQPWYWHKHIPKGETRKQFTHPAEKHCDICPLLKKGVCTPAGEKPEKVEGCPSIAYFETLEMLEHIFETRTEYFNRKILGIEDHFEIDIGNNVIINGYIDLVTELDKDTIEVIDWKTGTWTQNWDEAMKDIQMRMYCIAAMDLYPQYESYICTFDYVQKVPITVTFDRSDVEESKRWIKETWSSIAQCDKPQRTCNEIWKCNSICIGRDNCDKLWDNYNKKLSHDELRQSMAGILNDRSKR